MNQADLKHMPGNVVEQLDVLTKRVEKLERELLSAVITPDNGVFNGDVYNVPWTDYSADSTIVGWSSFTTKEIFYKRVGNLVFVAYRIAGTSDNTITTITLPFSYSSSGVSSFSVVIQIQDNGTLASGMMALATGSDTPSFFATVAGGAWTASGSKLIRGQFWYEAA